MLGLFNFCGGDPEIGVVSDRLADKAIELFVIKRGEPVVRDAAAVRRDGRPAGFPDRRQGDISEGLLADFVHAWGRFGRTPSQEDHGEQNSTEDGCRGLHVRLVQFEDQPIKLRTDTYDDLAQDVNGMSAVSEYGAGAFGTCGQKN